MIDSKKINKIFGINESFELVDKLMNIVMNPEEMTRVYKQIKALELDDDDDFIRDYFQEENAARKTLKQDYTPNCICNLLTNIISESDDCLDICSGSGSLTLAAYKKNKMNYVECEEISKQSIAVLLFNLSYRNIKAIVKEKDVLTNKIIKAYKLEPGENFCSIEEITKCEDRKFELIVSNPPYSLSWEPIEDERFKDYGLAPKAKADYAFVLDALSRLSEKGKAYIILPTGVLFRGNKEGEIRKKLIDANVIDSIIGMPGKLFMATDIPTIILVLNKNKKDDSIKFINASELFEHIKNKNNMNDEHIDEISNAYKGNEYIADFCRIVPRSEIVRNDYNLNIPRYVSKTIERKDIDFQKINNEIIEQEKKVKKIEFELSYLCSQLEARDNPELDKYFKESISSLFDYLINEKYEPLTDFEKNEIINKLKSKEEKNE